jgi:hypothetical protein
MENQQLVSPSHQCCSTPVGFDERYLSKEQCNNTEALPDFYLFTRLETISKRWRFCDTTEIIKNATGELKRLSQNFFSPATLQSLVDVHTLTRGLLRGKCSLNDCAVSYFSEIKWLRVSCHLFISLFTCINFVIPTHIYLNFYSLFICSCSCVYLFSNNDLFIFTSLEIYYLFLFIYLYLRLFVRICIFIYILHLRLFIHINIFAYIYLFTFTYLFLYSYVFVFL